jgi:hypothetical protein
MAFGTVPRAAPIAAAFHSRLFQVLVLLAFSVTAVQEKEPNTLFGIGTMSCKWYLDVPPDMKVTTMAVFTWVQGYFSALNTVTALHNGRAATVGGSVSADTLESMLKDQCREEGGEVAVWVAAGRLYDKLEAKGLQP